ncbi:hypothetical protein [Acanthopleuribacter pedis]|uniref:Uncharacterized protein n=1 Tax=Acanthopleuribacter pedis TaxID=442870 RepID=A0A8J7U343_9BACT|nr:hypothetical protein [Acanthopleuribacter pedis]MBO1317938.1 hypothetical protein [Acanthopleuribacter pedis]
MRTTEIQGFLLLGRETYVFSEALDPLTSGTWLDYTDGMVYDRRKVLEDALVPLNYAGYQEAAWFRAKAKIYVGADYGGGGGKTTYRRRVELLEILEASSEPVQAFLKNNPQYVPPPGWNPPPD